MWAIPIKASWVVVVLDSGCSLYLWAMSNTHFLMLGCNLGKKAKQTIRILSKIIWMPLMSNVQKWTYDCSNTRKQWLQCIQNNILDGSNDAVGRPMLCVILPFVGCNATLICMHRHFSLHSKVIVPTKGKLYMEDNFQRRWFKPIQIILENHERIIAYPARTLDVVTICTLLILLLIFHQVFKAGSPCRENLHTKMPNQVKGCSRTCIETTGSPSWWR